LKLNNILQLTITKEQKYWQIVWEFLIA
jgi:hypothetical protein